MSVLHVSPDAISSFQSSILAWYSVHKRNLPWRQTHDPYAILVSEVMLQQTQVNRVIPKYTVWLDHFPTITDLKNAPKTQLFTLWSGLGYNRRAIYLQKTAEIVVIKYNGIWPQSVQELETLPGIGPYTARAIAAFAFKQHVAVVDSNVKKVLFTHFPQIPQTIQVKELQIIADQLLPPDQAYDWNQALMDYSSSQLSHTKILTPKQSSFTGSNRYYRGKVMRLLIKHAQIDTNKIGYLLKEDFTAHDHVWLETLLMQMVKDGLISIENNMIKL